MASQTRILIDLNVILHTLQKREPYYDKSARFLARVENGSIEGFVAGALSTL